jgi:hypothetical protein
MPTPHAGLFRSLLEAADVQHTIVAGQHASAMSAARYAEKVTAPEVSDTEPMTENRMAAVVLHCHRCKPGQLCGRPKVPVYAVTVCTVPRPTS